MLDILYRDDHLIAIHKPPGLLVHRSEIDRHETRFAIQLLRDQIGQKVWPVHRLDRGTSGVLLFALTKEALTVASQSFEHNEVTKQYLAIVRGWPLENGLIDHPLTRQYDDYERRPSHDVSEAQTALTTFTRLATVELPISVERYPASRYALLSLQPKTGRRHQLRRHLKHIAHPIIGDATYGKGIHNRMFQREFNCHRLLLICLSMRLKHPVTGALIELQTQLDPDFSALVDALDWSGKLI